MEQSRGGGDYRDLYQPRCFSATPRSFSADALVPFSQLLDHVQHHRDDRSARIDDCVYPVSAVVLGDRFDKGYIRGIKVLCAELCRVAPTMCIAQHDLFQLIPELEEDIQPPPFQEAVERLYKRNAWIGPAGQNDV